MKTAEKLRCLFYLHVGPLAIPGQLFERPDPQGEDRYFWNFAGQFPWDVGDGLPPFRYEIGGRDLGGVLFYGVPQAMLKLLFDFEPKAAEKYRTENHRNCGNCEFLRFRGEAWDEYWNRPTSERYDAPPRTLYTCAVSGLAADHLPPETPYRRYKKELQASLLENSCDAHTRRAYKVELSLEARTQVDRTERWVPAEFRRLQCLNPGSISFSKDRTQLYLPEGLEIRVARDA